MLKRPERVRKRVGPALRGASPIWRSSVAPASCRQVAAAFRRRRIGWKSMLLAMPARCRRYVQAAVISDNRRMCPALRAGPTSEGTAC